LEIIFCSIFNIYHTTPISWCTTSAGGVGAGGASARPSLDLVKILEKSLKIWAKSLKTFTKSLKIWENPWKYEQKCRPKWHEESFWRPLFYGVFFKQDWGIRAKILRNRKNVPTPTSMCCTTTDLEIFWYCSWDFWSCICESPAYILSCGRTKLRFVLYHCSLFSAGIVLRKVYHGLPRWSSRILYCTKV